MEIQQKGFDKFIDLKKLTVSMKWTTATDFDLAAAYETKKAKRGLVYFGQLGSQDSFPYICLNQDDGVGDTAGEHEEILHISRLDDMNYIWLFCWDYSMVQQGKSARFNNSDVSLTMTDDSGNRLAVEIDTGERGNVYFIASLNNTNKGAIIVNIGLAGTLKGLKTFEQLMALVRYRNT